MNDDTDGPDWTPMALPPEDPPQEKKDTKEEQPPPRPIQPGDPDWPYVPVF